MSEAVVKMSPGNEIEKLLEEFKKNPDIEDVTLVSRSGMHIAGDIPGDAHRETFVAMSAILLGAAETATSELNEKLSHVVIELKGSKIIIQNGGPNALLATKITPKAEVEDILSESYNIIERIKEHL